MHWTALAGGLLYHEQYRLHEIPSESFKLLMTFNMDSFKVFNPTIVAKSYEFESNALIILTIKLQI